MARFDKTKSDVSFRAKMNKESAPIQLYKGNSPIKKTINSKIPAQDEYLFIVSWQAF